MAISTQNLRRRALELTGKQERLLSETMKEQAALVVDLLNALDTMQLQINDLAPDAMRYREQQRWIEANINKIGQ